MGEADVQSQLKQISSTRADLDRTIDELFAALPPKEQIVKQLGIIAGAGVAALTAFVVGASALRSRSEESSKRKDAQRNADALARALQKSSEELAPDDGSALPWFVVGAAVAGAGVAAWSRFSS